MGFASWMLLALVGFGMTEDRGILHASQPRRVPRAAYYAQSRSPARLSARWIGQDGHDYVGPNDKLGPSDIQDIHIAIAGLDPAREVVFLEVDRPTATSGDLQKTRRLACRIQTRERMREPATCSSSPPGSRPAVRFTFSSATTTASTAETDLRGGKADHKLRVTAVALAARWIGQDRQDRTGTGPSVGPDGFQDVRIHLSRLSTKLTLTAIRIAGPERRELGVRHRTPSCSRPPSSSAIPRTRRRGTSSFSRHAT